MGRKPTKLSVCDAHWAELLAQLDSVSDGRAKARLRIILKAAEGCYTLDDLARLAGCARSTIQAWISRFKQGGVAKLLERNTPPGSTSPIGTATVQAQLKAGLKAGRWPSASAVAAWLKEAHGICRAPKSIYYWFQKLHHGTNAKVKKVNSRTQRHRPRNSLGTTRRQQ
jgi:transposase-like protein